MGCASCVLALVFNEQAGERMNPMDPRKGMVFGLRARERFCPRKAQSDPMCGTRLTGTRKGSNTKARRPIGKPGLCVSR